jgi:hypothetical protein
MTDSDVGALRRRRCVRSMLHCDGLFWSWSSASVHSADSSGRGDSGNGAWRERDGGKEERENKGRKPPSDISPSSPPHPFPGHFGAHFWELSDSSKRGGTGKKSYDAKSRPTSTRKICFLNAVTNKTRLKRVFK